MNYSETSPLKSDLAAPIARVSCFPKSSHLYLPLPGEEASVFKCSVSRETECSRVGKQSFIITLGCNSVLLQFSSPAGMYHTSQRECNTLHRGNTEVVMCMHEAVLLLCWVLPLTSEEKSTHYLTSNMVVVLLQSNTKKIKVLCQGLWPATYFNNPLDKYWNRPK